MTLADIRAKISAVKSELAQTTDAPCSTSEAGEKLSAYVRRVAGDGTARLAHPISMLAYGEDESSLNDLLAVRTPNDLAPLLAAVLGPEALHAALSRYLPVDSGNALTEAQRADTLAALGDELLSLEHAEEAIIEASELAGAPIARRADADPRAVIGLVCEDNYEPPPVIARSAPPAAPVKRGPMRRRSSSPFGDDGEDE